MESIKAAQLDQSTLTTTQRLMLVTAFGGVAWTGEGTIGTIFGENEEFKESKK
jgi:hypothetical protein